METVTCRFRVARWNLRCLFGALLIKDCGEQMNFGSRRFGLRVSRLLCSSPSASVRRGSALLRFLAPQTTHTMELAHGENKREDAPEGMKAWNTASHSKSTTRSPRPLPRCRCAFGLATETGPNFQQEFQGIAWLLLTERLFFISLKSSDQKKKNKGYNLGMSSLMEAILKNQFKHVSLAVSFTFSGEK